MIYENFFYSLNIDSTNELDESKLFVENLEHNLKKIISFSNKEINNFKNDKYRKQSNIQFIPEKLLFSSPFTLFEGPKYSGKTSFMEYICKSISSKIIKLTYINKIKIINLLNYFPISKTDNSLNLFIQDIVSVLDNKDVKKSLHKYLFNVFEKNNTNELSINLDLIIKINKQINKPILFIIDNIEKIDSDFEAVLKIINKLSFINNFAFLFVVDGCFNRFTTNYSNDKDESVSKKYKELERFVNMPTYRFNQNYTCLLNKYDLNLDVISSINNILVEDKNYLISLKELNYFLTSVVENNNHVNKYKLLARLSSMLPNIKNRFIDVIYWNTNLFLDGLKKLKQLKDYKLLISEEFMNKRYNLGKLITTENSNYWYYSDIKLELEKEFEVIHSSCYNDKKWTKYRDKLLSLKNKIDIKISNIQKEISTIDKQISTNMVLKTKKSKIIDESLFSHTYHSMDDTNYEFASSETLNDKLMIKDPEEMNKNNQEKIEKTAILSNLEVIKRELESYFTDLENNNKELPERIKNFLKSENFRDDINALNKIFLDNKFKDSFLKENSSYKQILKSKSLEDVFNKNDNLNFLEELIRLVDDLVLHNYIIENYNELS